MADLLDKLERVERTVNIYKKKTNELIREINVDSIPLDKLKTFVVAIEDDYLLYLPYELNKKQLNSLLVEINVELKTDFRTEIYVLEATGIYNW